MTGQLGAVELRPCPDAYLSFDAGVQWLDASGCWLVSVGKSYTSEGGELESTVPWHKRYGEAEAPTAYQALMLGLSDYRNRQ